MYSTWKFSRFIFCYLLCYGNNFQDILSLAMMKGDAGVDIAFTLLAGGLISKSSCLCEPIKKMPGSCIFDVLVHALSFLPIPVHVY